MFAGNARASAPERFRKSVRVERFSGWDERLDKGPDFLGLFFKYRLRWRISLNRRLGLLSRAIHFCPLYSLVPQIENSIQNLLLYSSWVPIHSQRKTFLENLPMAR